MAREMLKNLNIENVFNAISDISSLQQAQIAGLVETMFSVSILRMNDQQLSFGPLVNSSVD